jgi:hypothetical protein
LKWRKHRSFNCKQCIRYVCLEVLSEISETNRESNISWDRSGFWSREKSGTECSVLSSNFFIDCQIFSTNTTFPLSKKLMRSKFIYSSLCLESRTQDIKNIIFLKKRIERKRINSWRQRNPNSIENEFIVMNHQTIMISARTNDSVPTKYEGVF